MVPGIFGGFPASFPSPDRTPGPKVPTWRRGGGTTGRHDRRPADQAAGKAVAVAPDTGDADPAAKAVVTTQRTVPRGRWRTKRRTTRRWTRRRAATVIGGLATLAVLGVAPGCTSTPPSSAPAPSPPSGAWWHPGPITSWQWQLTWPVDTSKAVQVYDIDYDGAGMGAPAQVAGVVRRLHAQGRKVICYLETGGWEADRPDAGAYPASILGNAVAGWQGERYVDVRQWGTVTGPTGLTLQQILEARLRQCRDEGFDAVETDIDDSYASATGFPLTLADEITFDTRVADAVHALGMAWFLKNGIDGDRFITDMAPLADGAVDEQCWQYDECPALEPFVTAGKPVLEAEYTGRAATVCPKARAFPMATMRKPRSLTATVDWACWS